MVLYEGGNLSEGARLVKEVLEEYLEHFRKEIKTCTTLTRSFIWMSQCHTFTWIMLRCRTVTEPGWEAETV